MAKGKTKPSYGFFRRLLRGYQLWAIHWRRRIARNRPALIIAGLVFLFLFAYLWPHILIRVGPGEAGVHYKLFGGGTVTQPVYGEGIHVIAPWNRMYIYDLRIQEREHSVELLTREGLKLTFKLSVRYRPEYELVGLLHKRVGPDYVETIVIPQVVSVLRVHVGQSTAEEVYTTKRAILQSIFAEAIEQAAQNHIVINQVIIRTIELPSVVQDAVEEKIEYRHIAESYEYRLMEAQQEAKRKKIEAEGFKEYNQIISESLTPEILKWKGVEATLEISKSPNSKVVVIGNGENGLPVILGADK